MAVVVSDGAGSARQSEAGAAITCTTLLEQVEFLLAQGRSISSVTDADAHQWLEAVREAIADRASDANHDLRNYACTMLFALVGVDAAVFLQVGDGVMVVKGQTQEWSWVVWPDRGEFANTTYFVTDSGAADHLGFKSRRGFIEEFALLSDGIESLVLHYASRSVHAPFFERMFQPVRRSKAIGQDLALSKDLESYLSSPTILERTDDDKTLVLATRRPQEVASPQ